MLRRIIGLLCCIFVFMQALAQENTGEMKSGIFVSFNDFRKNTPIPFSNIINNTKSANKIDILDAENTDFISYTDTSGIQQRLSVNKIWGISIDHFLYVRAGNEFAKIHIFGTLGFFSANVTYGPSLSVMPFSQELYYMDQLNSYSYITKQYIINLLTGNVFEFNQPTMLMLLSDDNSLRESYSKLSVTEAETSVFTYLRAFNSKHPFQFEK